VFYIVALSLKHIKRGCLKRLDLPPIPQGGFLNIYKSISPPSLSIGRQRLADGDARSLSEVKPAEFFNKVILKPSPGVMCNHKKRQVNNAESSECTFYPL
jgi:hypothetical protein